MKTSINTDIKDSEIINGWVEGGEFAKIAVWVFKGDAPESARDVAMIHHSKLGLSRDHSRVTIVIECDTSNPYNPSKNELEAGVDIHNQLMGQSGLF